MILLLIVKLLVSLVAVVFGANLLVDGAASVAKKTGVSDFLIGALIVGFGTSCPELVVSLTGAIQGNSEIAIGNVIGSNVFNTLFILGLTTVFFPIAVSETNRKRDSREGDFDVSFLMSFPPEAYAQQKEDRVYP